MTHRIYFVTGPSIKAFLRNGGSLPGAAYDKATDAGTFEVRVRTNFDRGQITRETTDFLPVVLREQATVEKEVAQFFEGWRTSMKNVAGGMLHELAEISLALRFAPNQPHYRWFSDGFAETLAARLIETYVSPESAKAYRDRRNVAKYEKLRRSINLLYWMMPNWEIKTPLEFEDALTDARYAFAMFEVSRLIDKHGIDSIKRILDPD